MDRNQLFPLDKVESTVDLGVRFDNNLTFRDHISEKINKAYSVLGIIKRNFIYMDERTFTLLYNLFIKDQLCNRRVASDYLLRINSLEAFLAAADSTMGLTI